MLSSVFIKNNNLMKEFVEKNILSHFSVKKKESASRYLFFWRKKTLFHIWSQIS